MRPTVSLSLLLVLALAPIACGTAVVTPTPTASADASTGPSAQPTAPASDPATVAAWEALNPAGAAPAPRTAATWVVDPGAGVAYLFGGSDDASTYGDLWRFDLAADTWEEMSVGGPGPGSRTGHVAGWVDGLGVLVIGGLDGDGRALADGWAFDPVARAWRPVGAASAPPARSGACLAVGRDGRAWLSGGLTTDGRPVADVWAYDPPTDAWTEASPQDAGPPARAGHICLWTADDRLVVHGGRGSDGVLGDVWALADPGVAGEGWSDLSGIVALPARADAAATMRQDRFLAVGGLDEASVVRGDLSVIDATTLEATVVGAGDGAPPARSGAALVDDPAAERLVLFGGATQGGVTGDLWQLRIP